MSEYWVSKKKYFCKYCDIYIADDAPSRQHHESGMRHKGSVERYIRQIYKTGEKQKKDLEEEKREMKRIEQAANAAFAQDVATGAARAVAPIASTSKPQKPVKPSNPFANYSTAESLGFTDPDAERIAAELEKKKVEGAPGEWEVITPVPSQVPTESEPGQGDQIPLKREAAGPLDDEDTRSFKLRKRTVNTGLGEIYDPGLIPIKLKKKEPTEVASSIVPASEHDKTLDLTAPLKFNPLQLTKISGGQDVAVPSTFDEQPASSSTNAKWSKAQWSESLQDLKEEQRFSIFKPVDDNEIVPPEEAATLQTEVKEEEDVKPDLNNIQEQSTSVVFKKRKTPANAGARGRRQPIP